MSQLKASYLPVFSLLNLSLPSEDMVNNSAVQPAYRDTQNAIYIGQFTLEGVPAIAFKIAQERQGNIQSVIADLKQVRESEEDEQVAFKIDMAIKKAELKIHRSYSDFEYPFTQACLDKIKLKISSYEKQEREREKQFNDDNKHWNGDKKYHPFFNDAIQKLRVQIQKREQHIYQYTRSHAGYIAYLKSTLLPQSYAFFLHQLEARIPVKNRKSSYLLAKSQSGKSELIKTLIYSEIQNISDPTRAIILIDPHGDMANQIAHFKEFATPEGRERLVYLDPVMRDGYLFSINPFLLEQVTDKNVNIMTQELKGILIVLLSGSAPTLQMDAILSPCISTLLRRKNSSMEDLQRFMDDKNNSDLIACGCKNPNPAHRKLFEANGKFHDKSYEATKHGIYTRIQTLINDPLFQGLISNTTTIPLQNLVDEKKIILMKLPLGEVGEESVKAFGRFIIGMMKVIALQRSTQPKHKRVPVDLYVDEFQNFVTPDIETALTQLKKYGLFLTLAHQNVNQEGVSTSLQKTLFGADFMGFCVKRLQKYQ